MPFHPFSLGLEYCNMWHFFLKLPFFVNYIPYLQVRLVLLLFLFYRYFYIFVWWTTLCSSCIVFPHSQIQSPTTVTLVLTETKILLVTLPFLLFSLTCQCSLLRCPFKTANMFLKMKIPFKTANMVLKIKIKGQTKINPNIKSLVFI